MPFFDCPHAAEGAGSALGCAIDAVPLAGKLRKLGDLPQLRRAVDGIRSADRFDEFWENLDEGIALVCKAGDAGPCDEVIEQAARRAQTGASPTAAESASTAPLATASVGPGAASVADPAFSSGPRLYRFGLEAETADDLARQASAAVGAGFPHGVSAYSRTSRSDAVSALRSAIEQHFPVIKTGRNPFHYTIELPSPVTAEAAETFNILFGRGASSR